MADREYIDNLLKKEVEELDNVELKCVVDYFQARYDKLDKDINKFGKMEKVTDVAFGTGWTALLVETIVGDGFIKSAAAAVCLPAFAVSLIGNLYLMTQNKKRAELADEQILVGKKLQEAKNEAAIRTRNRANEKAEAELPEKIVAEYLVDDLCEDEIK